MNELWKQIGKPVVTVDYDIKDLIPDYLEKRREDLSKIKNSFYKKDYTSISRLGHIIKGSGGSFGFNDLSYIGKSLEHAAEKKDAKTIRKSIDELTHYLDNVKVVYK